MATKVPLRDRKRANTRSALVSVSVDLFEKQGFTATTVEQIADAAEFSQSTFFRYFGNKEDVLFADVGEHLTGLAQRLQDNLPAAASVWDGVVQSVEGTTAAFIASDAEFGVRRIELWMSEPQLRSRYIDHAEAWQTTVSEAVAAHRGRSVTDDVYASVVGMAAVSAFRIAVESFRADSSSLADRLDRAFVLLGAGLQTEPESLHKSP